MKKDISQINYLPPLAKLFCLGVLLLGLHQSLKAQPILSAKSIALGGSGTAYISGLEATFWNPANMAISNRAGKFHFGLGHAGVLYQPVLSTDAADDQFLDFTDSFYPYRQGMADITANQRAGILSENYPRRRLLSQHQSRTDFILGGALWQRGDEAFSIAARARMASRIEVGRGWYSRDFIPTENREVRDFTLAQHKGRLYEFSAGYAREFTFYNGLSPRLNKLFVGISPKLVVAGPSVEVTYDARYMRSPDGNSTIYTNNFFYRSTGKYSQAAGDYLLSGNPQQAISSNFNRKYNFQPTGYGFGFDFGLTYLLPLGDELPGITSKNSIVPKSIRFALSVNDLGMIRYNQKPLTLSTPTDTTQIAQQPVMNSMFIGAEGQYLAYFDAADTLANPLSNAQSRSQSNYSLLLPTSVNAGFLIDLSRLKLTGGLTLGLNNTAFTTTKLAIHLGLEARPIQQIPVRLGTRFASGLPTYIGFGTGFETRYWDFTIGTQIIYRSQELTSEFAGGAFAGLQIHL